MNTLPIKSTKGNPSLRTVGSKGHTKIVAMPRGPLNKDFLLILNKYGFDVSRETLEKSCN